MVAIPLHSDYALGNGFGRSRPAVHRYEMGIPGGEGSSDPLFEQSRVQVAVLWVPAKLY
jgi:hypothetical protein